MQTAQTVALTTYTGPLGRFLERQAKVKASAAAEAQRVATVRAMRANIAGMMIEPLFNDGERLRCNDSIYQTECVAKLQTWFRNVYRVYKERETSLYVAFNDGTCAFLPVAA